MSRARQRAALLRFIALACSLAALSALLDPDRVATRLGMLLVGVTGYSQFYAVYVGARLATAGVALLAARHGDQPLLGDITALMILAQPAGRLIAAFSIGLPQGFLLVVSGIELVGGIALLMLRPRSAMKNADEIRNPHSTPHHH